MESNLYDKKENGVCICRVCPRQCRILPSRKGWCRTRWNDHGMLKTLTYGLITSAALDPIEKKPLAVGDRLPNEFELAEMFEVGRSTIREAVKGLVTKGVLQVRRGAGTYVQSLTPVEDDPLGLTAKLHDKFKLALDLFDVRLILEPEIAAKAAVYATDEDIETLKRLCKETEELYLADKDHMPKDIEFHTWIARCSKNQVMESLIPIINSGINTFVNLTRRALRTETIVTHRAITEAIASHDSTGARCAMVMHLTYNRQELLRRRTAYEQMGDEA